MTLPTLPQSLPQLVIEAMQAAGATEEMIAAAVKASGEWLKASGEFPTPQAGRRGRPRKYRTRAECDRAYYERCKLSEKNHEENKDKTSPHEKTHEKIPPEELREETLALTRVLAALRRRLEAAAGGNFDPMADVEPIRALLDPASVGRYFIVAVPAFLQGPPYAPSPHRREFRHQSDGRTRDVTGRREGARPALGHGQKGVQVAQPDPASDPVRPVQGSLKRWKGKAQSGERILPDEAAGDAFQAQRFAGEPISRASRPS
jgi:hypothetical protein